MIKVDHILGPKGFVQNIFRAQFMSASNIKLISSVLIRQLSIRYPIIAQNYAKFENIQSRQNMYSWMQCYSMLSFVFGNFFERASISWISEGQASR